MSHDSRGNLSRNDDFAIGWSRSHFYAIFSVNRYAYCVWLLHKYEAHMKGLPICFSEVQVKNDVTDNNNKHFVTAFECRNIIELREHLKLSEHLRYRMSTMLLSMEVYTKAWKTVSALPSTLLSVRLFVSLARSPRGKWAQLFALRAHFAARSFHVLNIS